MIAVIFQVRPETGKKEEYLEIAASLAAHLREMNGFLSIERFQSLVDTEKILSLSFWRDEAAVTAWRSLECHRDAQAAGRARVFADYRLRVADVVRDYGMTERAEAPSDSRSVHG